MDPLNILNEILSARNERFISINIHGVSLTLDVNSSDEELVAQFYTIWLKKVELYIEFETAGIIDIADKARISCAIAMLYEKVVKFKHYGVLIEVSSHITPSVVIAHWNGYIRGLKESQDQ